MTGGAAALVLAAAVGTASAAPRAQEAVTTSAPLTISDFCGQAGLDVRAVRTVDRSDAVSRRYVVTTLTGASSAASSGGVVLLVRDVGTGSSTVYGSTVHDRTGSPAPVRLEVLLAPPATADLAGDALAALSTAQGTAEGHEDLCAVVVPHLAG